MSDVHQDYLRDLVTCLRSQAEEAAATQRAEPLDASFQDGRALAYVEVLGHMQSQADGFLLDREALNSVASMRMLSLYAGSMLRRRTGSEALHGQDAARADARARIVAYSCGSCAQNIATSA